MNTLVRAVAWAWAAAALSSCAASTPGRGSYDDEGCWGSYAVVAAALAGERREALDRVHRAPTLVEARRAAVEFLRLCVERGTDEDAYCQLKTALATAPQLGATGVDTWSYWTAREVVAESCTDAAYRAARRHLLDLELLSSCVGEPDRTHTQKKQREVVETFHAHVVSLDLCPGPPAAAEPAQFERTYP